MNENKAGKCPACNQLNNYPVDGLCQKCYDRLQHQKKIAAHYILYYDQIKQEIDNALSEFAELTAAKMTGEPGGGNIGNISQPTEEKAINLAELRERQLWLVAVDDMMRRLDKRRKLFIKLRRDAEIYYEDTKRYGTWTEYVADKFAELSERKLGRYQKPHRSTLFYWWNDAIQAVLQIAALYRIL